MDRWIKPLLLQRAVEMQFHVSGALEFFENEFVHPAACLGQGGREYSEAAPFFTIARGAEKFLWFDKRLRLDTARHDPAFAWLQIVIPAREPRNTVEQDHDILF